MTIRKKVEHNLETGELIVRNETPEEIALAESYEAATVEAKAAEIAKQEAKASALAKLAALGLTEDEAKAVFGA